MVYRGSEIFENLLLRLLQRFPVSSNYSIFKSNANGSEVIFRPAVHPAFSEEQMRVIYSHEFVRKCRICIQYAAQCFGFFGLVSFLLWESASAAQRTYAEEECK